MHITDVVFHQNLGGILGVRKFGCRHGTSPYRFWFNALYFKCSLAALTGGCVTDILKIGKSDSPG
jgi:hypothetical protein